MHNKYTVIVSNVGIVVENGDYQTAIKAYTEYVQQSKSYYGRASGEDVVILQNEEILFEYFGANSRE